MRKDFTERLLRGLYSALLYALLPVTLYHLIWRGFRSREYFQRWNERYASYEGRPRPVDVWVHAVSVGEVNAAAPVVNALRKRHPHLKLLVTTITPTGSERVRALWGEAVEHVYVPYDIPGAVRRFLHQHRPAVGLVMETELWPNLLFGCRDAGVPVYILNARLSARSLKGYRVMSALIRRVLGVVRKVGAQSHDDGERFIQLGACREQVVDTGNLKFDIAVPDKTQAIRAAFHAHQPERPVWIAASTHEDEEAAVIEAHRALRRRWPDLLLLWAPRHPERFGRAAELAREAGFHVGSRRADTWPAAGDDVFVLDTLGELMAFYGCADVAFVGGSLQAIGGHNLLEPAAVGTATVTGPHLHNFTEIARRLQEAGALDICADAQELITLLERLLADTQRRMAMVKAGCALVEAGRGALEKTLAMVAPDLPQQSTAGSA